MQTRAQNKDSETENIHWLAAMDAAPSFADIFAEESPSKRSLTEQEHESHKSKRLCTEPEILVPAASGSGSSETCSPSVAWAKHLREGMVSILGGMPVQNRPIRVHSLCSGLGTEQYAVKETLLCKT
eukprot:6457924-Amphidinium_carterae.1